VLIYIVDDNLDMCEFLSFLLGNEGYRVHAFPCPVEALDHMKAQNNKPTILVTDYNMPKLNGFELHQQVIDLAPEVKTIVISGRNVNRLIGKLNFLQKPFAPEHLLNLIKAVTT